MNPQNIYKLTGKKFYPHIKKEYSFEEYYYSYDNAKNRQKSLESDNNISNMKVERISILDPRNEKIIA